MVQLAIIANALIFAGSTCCANAGAATTFHQVIRPAIECSDTIDKLPAREGPPREADVDDALSAVGRSTNRSVTEKMIADIRDKTRSAIVNESARVLKELRGTTPSSRELAQMKVSERNRYLKYLAQERKELIARKNRVNTLLKRIDSGTEDDTVEQYIKSYWRLEDELDEIEAGDTRALAMRDPEMVAAYFASELTSEVGIIAAKIGEPTGRQAGEFICEFTYKTQSGFQRRRVGNLSLVRVGRYWKPNSANIDGTSRTFEVDVLHAEAMALATQVSKPSSDLANYLPPSKELPARPSVQRRLIEIPIER